MSRKRAAAHYRGMARLARLDLPGIPQHVVQRGNYRLPCFLDDTDRRRYLTLQLCCRPNARCAASRIESCSGSPAR